jgi:hypothetical protein
MLVLKRVTASDEASTTKIQTPHRLEARIGAIEKKLDRILGELENLQGQLPGRARRAGDN